MKRRRPVKGSDDGATLVLVLIIIVALSMVIGVVLSEVDTSERASLASRDQAANSYNADGAAQAAINELTNDNFAGTAGACATSAIGLALPNFYPASNGDTAGASSAYVQCTPDSSNAGGGNPTAANTSPGSALLTLDPNLAENGIALNLAGQSGPVRVRGGIFSNSAISAQGGLQNVWSPPSGATTTTYNIARGACTPPGSVTVANPAHGTTTCNFGTTADPRGRDPGTLSPHGASYNAPPPATGNGTIGSCSGGKTFQSVTPGRFTDANALSNLSGCSKNIVVFQPGIYYFDFSAANPTWFVPSTFLIAGTPTIPLNATPTAAQMPTACVAPGDAAATSSSGVEFVFGGVSQLNVNSSGGPGSQMTICASASPNGPPIAVYGLKASLGGTFPVSAQVVCPPTTLNCAMINTGNSPKTTLTIQGTTYVPNGLINIVLNNATRKVFYWGLIAYAIAFGATGNPDFTSPLIDVPDTAANPTPTPSIVYLDVYICPGSSTCSSPSAGVLRLRVKAKLAASSAPRAATVLSWSEQQ